MKDIFASVFGKANLSRVFFRRGCLLPPNKLSVKGEEVKYTLGRFRGPRAEGT